MLPAVLESLNVTMPLFWMKASPAVLAALKVRVPSLSTVWLLSLLLMMPALWKVKDWPEAIVKSYASAPALKVQAPTPVLAAEKVMLVKVSAIPKEPVTIGGAPAG